MTTVGVRRVGCAREGARAHITTAAATIVHRMDSGHARQTVTLEAERGSLLEYLPDSLILFRGARLANELTLRVHAHARASSRFQHGIDDRGNVVLSNHLHAPVGVPGDVSIKAACPVSGV